MPPMTQLVARKFDIFFHSRSRHNQFHSIACNWPICKKYTNFKSIIRIYFSFTDQLMIMVEQIALKFGTEALLLVIQSTTTPHHFQPAWKNCQMQLAVGSRSNQEIPISNLFRSSPVRNAYNNNWTLWGSGLARLNVKSKVVNFDMLLIRGKFQTIVKSYLDSPKTQI